MQFRWPGPAFSVTVYRWAQGSGPYSLEECGLRALRELLSPPLSLPYSLEAGKEGRSVSQMGRWAAVVKGSSVQNVKDA